MPSPLLRIARVLSILLLTCLPASGCAAQDARVRDSKWVLLDSVDPRVYLDSSRVEIADGQHIVWLWIQRTEPLTLPEDTAPVWGMRIRHHLDCAARLAEETEMVILRDREGTQLDPLPQEGTRRKPFASHPLGQSILPLACQWLSRHRPARG